MSQNGQKKAISPTPQLHITVLFPKKISSLLKIFSLFHLAIWSTFCNAIAGYLSRFKFKNPVNSSFYKIESLRRKKGRTPSKVSLCFTEVLMYLFQEHLFFPPFLKHCHTISFCVLLKLISYFKDICRDGIHEKGGQLFDFNFFYGQFCIRR